MRRVDQVVDGVGPAWDCRPGHVRRGGRFPPRPRERAATGRRARGEGGRESVGIFFFVVAAGVEGA
eukprot:scaffold148229_cov31-Tisochrysis_lutea.AAC.2